MNSNALNAKMKLLDLCAGIGGFRQWEDQNYKI